MQSKGCNQSQSSERRKLRRSDGVVEIKIRVESEVRGDQRLLKLVQLVLGRIRRSEVVMCSVDVEKKMTNVKKKRKVLMVPSCKVKKKIMT